MRRTVGLISAMALAGCQTHLATYPDTVRTAPEVALTGPSYALSMLQYNLEATYTVTACPAAPPEHPPTRASQSPDGEGAAPAMPAAAESSATEAETQPTEEDERALVIKVEVKATPAYIAGERYIIDYTRLSSGMKTSDFVLEAYPNGALKSVNASVQDQTGPFVAGAVKFGAAVATLASGNPAGVALAAAPLGVIAPPSDTPATSGGTILSDEDQDTLMALVDARTTPVCSPEVEEALTAKKSAVAEVKKIKLSADAAGLAVAAILARAQVRLATRADRAELARLQGVVATSSADLARHQAAISTANEVLVHTFEYRWPETAFTRTGMLSSSRATSAWLASTVVLAPTFTLNETRVDAARREGRLSHAIEAVVVRLEENVSTARLCDADATLAACLGDDFTIHAELADLSPTAGVLLASAEQEQQEQQQGDQAGKPWTPAEVVAWNDRVDAGLFFRDAAVGRLVLCRSTPTCGEASPAGTWTEPLLVGERLSAPQLGQLRFLPLSNGTFQNNALSLALSENGALVRLQYAEKSSIAAEMAASASSAVEAINAWRTEREEAQAEADAAAQARVEAQRAETVAGLTHQIEVLTRQQQLAALQHPAAPSALDAETTLLEAQISNLEARLRLAQAVAALNPPAT